MTAPQSNKERMGDTLSNIFSSNAAVYSASVSFKKYVDAHTTNLANVRKWKNAQAEAIGIIGMNRDKEAMRMLMAAEAAVIIGAIKNFALDTKNNELSASVNYSQSFLEKCRETTFTSSCNQVLKVAQTNAASILSYGVTATMITNFAADITAYQTIMTKGRSKQVEVTTYTKNLAASLAAMMHNISDSLVNGIKQYRTTAPDFVNAFMKGKKIVNVAGTSIGIHGRVTDAETGQHLSKIVVEIVELGMLTSTNGTGMYEFKRVPMGKYTFRFRGAGYTTTELPVQLEDGKLKVVDIKVEKALAQQLVSA